MRNRIKNGGFVREGVANTNHGFWNLYKTITIPPGKAKAKLFDEK